MDKTGANYKLIRSRRRTISIELRDGAVLVRAPYYADRNQIERFIEDRKGWIEKQLDREAERARKMEGVEPLTKEELSALADEALRVIPERVRYYAPLVGVDYGRITIRAQRTRWGSCSQKGNLNFNCLLMLAPPEVLDGVVVHELCHRKVMNHSPRFYAEVARIYPDYKVYQKWLRENGEMLMRRLPGMPFPTVTSGTLF